MNVLRGGMRAVRGFLGRLTEHQLLFPAMAVLVLAIIWSTTANLNKVELANAERAAASSTLELLDTYEAQMLRNLREIDHTLKIVKFAYESSERPAALAELKTKALLPPDLLFTLTIADAKGNVLASTRRTVRKNVAREDYFRGAVAADALFTGRPRHDDIDGEWKLDFSRRLTDARGAFAGAVMLSVDAQYFVSSYEPAKLGEQGVLALVGAQDGTFWVRRSGDAIASGDAAIIAPAATRDAQEPVVVRGRSPWDGVHRFTTTRALYGFPVVLLVGLAEGEQLGSARASTQTYIWRASIASLLLLAFIGILGRVSWKLAQTAKRENESKIAHAERIQYLAYHDGLTGLPNRALFSRMLEQGIHHAHRDGRSLAVLFLDLDRFKQINDTLGHHAGDQLLKELSLRLQSCLRESDTVARLGGDEFVVLLPGFDEEKYVATVAQKLLSIVSQPFVYKGQSLIVTTSIGIAVYPRDGRDEQALMKCADTAMYHAKGEGKDNFQFYAQKLQANTLRRLRLETALRRALEDGELELHYQPKIDLLTERITGAEALLRWHSREHGTVVPADFIPIAEDTGIIVDIGRWALETACAQNVAWRRQGLPPISMAVNLSVRQFADSNLLDDITAILARTGFDPALLELEITESLLMSNVERAIRTLSAFDKMGVRLAIDDFGTGYSSLSNLKRFPLTTLKIDRAFIGDLPHDVEDRVITEAVIGMGKALDMTVVAEGVESAEQVHFLREHACDEYQGYYFSPPVPAIAFAKLLANNEQLGLMVQPLRATARASMRAR